MVMATICAFCLSNDRILTLIDEKYSKIVDFCKSTFEDDDLEYIQCLQRKQALQICWECSTKLKNFHQFISTSQQCVRVLNTYLESSTQILPPTTSKLCTSNMEIIDINPKYKEFKTEEETQRADVTDTETEDVADTIHTGPIYEETETEDITDNLDMGPIYEETETEHLTETLDVKMEIDSVETLSATTSNLYRTQIDIVETDPEFEGTRTEYVTDTETEDEADTIHTEPIYEDPVADDVTETLDIKMENDSLETLSATTTNLYRTQIDIVETDPEFEGTRTEYVTDTETEDEADTIHTEPIYEDPVADDVTETLDIKMENDSLETLSATTSNLYRTQLDIVETDPEFEGTRTEYVTDTETEDEADTIHTEPIYEDPVADDVTETLDIKMENDSLETLSATTTNLYRTQIDIVETDPEFEGTRTEYVTDTETEDEADTIHTEPIYEDPVADDVTETLDIKMENDSLETLSATTSNLYRTQIDIVETDPEFEGTRTEYVTDTETEDEADTIHTEPIYEDPVADDVTETLDIKMENDSLETEVNDTPDNNNAEVINSDIREDPCTSVDLEMIKEQVVWWRLILHRLPTDTLPANIMSSGAPVTISDGTNNCRIEAIEDAPRVEALHEVTDCISKQQATKKNEENISKKDKVNNKKITVLKIPEQKKMVSLTYICDHCKQEFNTKMKLQQHISIHYGVSEVNLTCQTCNYKGDTVQALEKHSRLHDEKRRFKCNSCTYRFSSNRELMRHVQTHTGEKQHKCDLCDYASSRSSNLKIHMRIHTGEKKYKCDFCDFASSQGGNLKRHKRIHSGEKQYKCDLCDYASSQSSSLKIHMRIHTGEKQYKCDLCDYASSYSNHLKRHVRIHTGEKKIKCDLCEYRSSDSGHLSRHKKRLHAASSAT